MKMVKVPINTLLFSILVMMPGSSVLVETGIGPEEICEADAQQHLKIADAHWRAAECLRNKKDIIECHLKLEEELQHLNNSQVEEWKQPPEPI